MEINTGKQWRPENVGNEEDRVGDRSPRRTVASALGEMKEMRVTKS